MNAKSAMIFAVIIASSCGFVKGARASQYIEQNCDCLQKAAEIHEDMKRFFVPSPYMTAPTV